MRLFAVQSGCTYCVYNVSLLPLSPRINRVGRISRIAKRATQVAPRRRKGRRVCLRYQLHDHLRVCPFLPPCQTASGHSTPPSFSGRCIFSPFRGSNRVVDCSAAKEKAYEDRDEGEEGSLGRLSTSRKIPTTGNRLSRLPLTVRRRTPRRLSPCSRISPSLLLSSLPSLFAASPSTPSFFGHEEQEETKSGRPERGRKRDERERSQTSTMEGYAEWAKGGTPREGGKMVEERKRAAGKRTNESGRRGKEEQQFRHRPRRGSHRLKKIGGEWWRRRRRRVERIPPWEGGGGGGGGDAWHPPRSFLSHTYDTGERYTGITRVLGMPSWASRTRAEDTALARSGRCFCAKFSTNKAPRRRRVATPTPPFQARNGRNFPSFSRNQWETQAWATVGRRWRRWWRRRRRRRRQRVLPPLPPPPPPTPSPSRVDIILGYVSGDTPT